MNSLLSLATLVVLASSYSLAQLTIENPKQLDVPEIQARLLLQMSRRAVTKELHLHHSAEIEFGFRLVLGEKDERYGWDDNTGNATLFLRAWDAKKFVTAAIKFAVQRSIDSQRQEQMILETLRRSEQTSPVPATQLRGFVGSRQAPLKDRNSCLSRISDASVRDVGCNAILDMKTR